MATALCATALPALAAQQTLVGSTFTVTYDDALLGLYGTPTLVGDSLRWFPSGSPGFTADTSNGFDSANSTFSLKVTANPGYLLNSFSFAEAGDYLFFGGSGASSGVNVSGQLRVTPLPGSTTISPITLDAPVAANSFLDFTNRNWSASAMSAAVPQGTTTANVSIQNILAAYVLGGPGFAFVEKREVNLGVMTSPVPEPETYALLLAGLGVIGFLQVRRRAG